MTPIALVRAVWMFTSIVLACTFAFIGTYGLSLEDSQKPLSTWRRCVRWTISNCFMRSFFWGAGFLWVNVTGKQAPPQEAPILVVAPHSSFWDAFVLTMLGSPSVVAKLESKDMLFFGKLINFTQPVYVERDSVASRRKSAQAIVNRAQQILKGEPWPQIFIFPEGTCSNRSCLIDFKPGAFIPGVPVQPVLIRYPNKFDCATWTFDSPHGVYSAFLTMLQFRTYLEIEFLPVHTPTEEEKKDAKLYSQNIRRIMANALGIPTKDIGYEDGIMMGKFRDSSLRKRLHVVRTARQSQKIKEGRELEFITENNNFIDWKVTPQGFLEQMKVERLDAAQSQEVQEMFNVFNTESHGAAKKIDLREYIFIALFFQTGIEDSRLISILFWMYCQDKSSMPKDTFISMMGKIFETKEKDSIALFQAGENEDVSMISLDSFKKKLQRRIECVKFYAVEETGDLGGNYPPLESRAELKNHKLKVD